MSPLLSSLFDVAIGVLSATAIGGSAYAFVVRPQAKKREAEENAKHAAELERLRGIAARDKQIAEYHAARAELAESEVAKSKTLEKTSGGISGSGP